MQNLFGQLDHWNKLTPSKEFIFDGDVVLTFAEAYDRALRFAGGLKALGLKTGDRVAALVLNGYRWYDLYYGFSAGRPAGSEPGRLFCTTVLPVHC